MNDPLSALGSDHLERLERVARCLLAAAPLDPTDIAVLHARVGMILRRGLPDEPLIDRDACGAIV